VYVSQNAGASWLKLFVGDPKAFVATISVNPSNPAAFVVGSHNQRSYATPNSSGFATIAQPTTSEYRIGLNEIITIPALNLQVAASGEGMLTRQISYGATPSWVRRLSGLSDAHFTSVIAHPQNPRKVVAGSYGGGLYVSNDGGLTWAKANVTLANRNVETLAAYGTTTLLVGTAGDGVYTIPWP
jgi:hypothetical protein